MRRMWTEAEEKYMERYYLFQPVQKTAKKLDRTVSAVYKKAHLMKLVRYDDALNVKMLAECFHYKRKTVIGWIQKYNLPCKKSKYWRAGAILNSNKRFLEMGRRTQNYHQLE